MKSFFQDTYPMAIESKENMEMAWLATLLENLDQDDQKRGKQFELICKWFLENDPCYKLQLKKVWLWKDWPQRPGPDIGIDLVAETHSGEFWAIQTKAYNPKSTISKPDIDSFLSASSTSTFSYRLLIATTNLIGRHAEQTLSHQEKGIGRKLLHDLEISDLDWPESPNELYSTQISLKKPFPHQENAIKDVIAGLATSDRGQLIMACGTGKTLVGLWVSETLACERTLVLVPSLTLLAQILREWCYNASCPFEFLPVCSDDTVREEDNLISNVSELGVPATTKTGMVISFLKRTNHCVVFATYHSSPIIAEAFSQESIREFDLVIADEAHRIAGTTDSAFATILDQKAIKANRRLFMTATPKYLTGKLKKMARDRDFDLASMDDATQFGPVLHRLSFAEAIRNGLLSDYQLSIAAITSEEYRNYVENREMVKLPNSLTMDARRLASTIYLAKTAQELDLRKVISFHSSINRAATFSKDLRTVFELIGCDGKSETEISSEFVSGDMPSGKRDTLLATFRNLDLNYRGFLANVRCLTEGVDVPTLDGVAFIDPKRSQIEIVQAVGRAIRKSEDKKVGTIIIPVFIDENQDLEAVFQSSPFEVIWSVVRALRAHDDDFAEQLDQFRNQLGRMGKNSLIRIPKTTLDIPIKLGKDFIEALQVKIVENSTDIWEFWFGLLQRYLDDNGHVNVPNGFKTPEGYNLDQWVVNQRQFFRRGWLLRERETKLEKLSGWSWARRQDWWHQGYNRLLEYVRSEGHALVSQEHVTSDGFKLGSWVGSQRQRYRERKLIDARIGLLEKLPGWSWNAIDSDWEKGIAAVRHYLSTYGHLMMNAKFVTEDGFRLGEWIDHKRQAYKKGKLLKDRMEILESIPAWIWDILEASWNNHYNSLLEFAEKEGHARVPRKYLMGGLKLGVWVDRQRNDYRRGKLPVEREKLLEQVKGWTWDPHAAQWEEGFQRLVVFVKENGTALVPAKHETANKFLLGRWVDIQRRFFRDNQLSDERIKRLEELNGWSWNPLQDVWEKNLQYIRDYVEEFGHASIQSNYKSPDGFGLGGLCERLRGQFRKGNLPEDRQRVLEQFPGWTWNPGRMI